MALLHRLFGGKSESNTFRLHCLIEGDTTVSVFDISGHAEIGILKKCIHEGAGRFLKPVDAKDLILVKVSLQIWHSCFNYVIIFDQVKIDLPKHQDSLQSITATSQEVENATELRDWEPISKFWQSSPPGHMLSVFATLVPAGEQKHIAVNGTLFITRI